MSRLSIYYVVYEPLHAAEAPMKEPLRGFQGKGVGRAYRRREDVKDNTAKDENEGRNGRHALNIYIITAFTQRDMKPTHLYRHVSDTLT